MISEYFLCIDIEQKDRNNIKVNKMMLRNEKLR